jgi:hypothetical protein
MQYKKTSKSIADIGRELKVETLLEGSVRKAATKLRISAQLINVDNGYHLCDPQPHSPGELAEMFAESIGKSFAYVPVPMAVAKAFFAPKPVQRFFGMPPQALDYFDDPVRHDTTQATQDLGELGIECPRLADYIPRLVAFYRSHRETVRKEAMI